MEISFRFEGFEEVQRGVEALSSSAEIGAINKKIFQRSADITEPKMKAHMARSADNSKSGRNGYRPPGHARDNIPKKVTTKKRRSRMGIEWRRAKLVLHEVCGVGDIENAATGLPE